MVGSEGGKVGGEVKWWEERVVRWEGSGGKVGGVRVVKWEGKWWEGGVNCKMQLEQVGMLFKIAGCGHHCYTHWVLYAFS